MPVQSLGIGFVIDPIETLNPKKDSTLALIRESQKRGFRNYAITLSGLFLEADIPIAEAQRIELDGQGGFKVLEKRVMPLEDLDVVLMRKDPPVNVEYLMATYILDRLESTKTVVLNHPASLRNINEKVVVSHFPDLVPSNLLTSSTGKAMEFLEHHGKVVIKPTNKMGGQSVYVLEKGDPNISIILEDMTRRGSRFVVLQKYIPAISTQGDQRIILINGKPIDFGIARIPKDGDHRGNLVTGATAMGFELTAEHRRICKALAPYLVHNGLFFVGIDVIGGFVTEINITSPTGIVEIDTLFGIQVARTFFDALLEAYFP